MPSDDRSLEVNKTKILVAKRGTYKNYKKHILGDSGADGGGEGKSKRAEKYGTQKSKDRRQEPLGTRSYQTSSKRSLPF